MVLTIITEGQTDGQKDGQMDRRTDGQTDGQPRNVTPPRLSGIKKLVKSKLNCSEEMLRGHLTSLHVTRTG